LNISKNLFRKNKTEFHAESFISFFSNIEQDRFQQKYSADRVSELMEIDGIFSQALLASLSGTNLSAGRGQI